MNFHCLFEQSGTFKNVFKSYGHHSFDYDILDDYGQTDFKIDLFKEIENAYNYLIDPCDISHFNGNVAICKKYPKTIFDKMKPETDFIMAFFPCTHFCDRNELIYRLWNGGKRLPIDEKNTKKLIDRNQERAKFFELYLKFVFICKKLGIPTIIENPASGGGRNYMEMFSPIDVAYKDKNRALFGDNFKKPTNFFAINFEMKEVFEMYYDDNRMNTKRILDIESKSISTGGRSEITPRYADNFYMRFIKAWVEQTIKGEQK